VSRKLFEDHVEIIRSNYNSLRSEFVCISEHFLNVLLGGIERSSNRFSLSKQLHVVDFEGLIYNAKFTHGSRVMAEIEVILDLMFI
jgi:hypothetical protein